MKRSAVLLCALAIMAGTGWAAAQKEAAGESGKPVKIRVFRSHNIPQFPLEKDLIRQALEKKLGIELDLNVITQEYESRINAMIAGNDIPDIFDVTAPQFRTLEPQGIFLNYEANLDSMPNMLATFPGIKTDTLGRYNGKLYFLPANYLRGESEVVPSYESLWVRKDWLDKLGLQVPKTLEELYAVAKAFRDRDPDGNGKNDTYGFGGMGGGNFGAVSRMEPFQNIYTAYGTTIPMTYTLRDGKVVYSSTDPYMKDALGTIKRMFDEKLVDPDILLVSTFDQLREKIYRQQIGLMWDMWAEFTKPPHGDQLKKMLPDAKWIQIAPVSGPRGSSNGIYSIPGPRTSGIVLSAKLPSDKAKFKAVLNYLDYLNTAEGYNTVSYGVEGTHFKVEGGKVVVDMVKAGDVSNAWQHQICGRAERQYLYTKFPGITADIGFVSSLKHTTVYNAFEVIPEGINKADKNKFEAEQMTRFILGQRPIAEFDAFVSTLNGTFKQELYTKSVEDNLRKAGILK